jgi:predicted esterase
VHGAVALAPWVLPTDEPAGLDDQRLLIVHGSADRIASPQRSAAVAERLRARARVEYLLVEGGKHAMLRHHEKFSAPAADFAVETLLPTGVHDSLDPHG